MRISTQSANAGDLEVQVTDVQTDNAGETVVVIVTPTADAENALVLVEGDGGVEVEGIAPVDMKHSNKGRTFLTGALKAGQSFKVKVFTALGRRAKISVAFLRSRVAGAWQDLPCKGCKLVVRTLIHAALAHFGLVPPDIFGGLFEGDPEPLAACVITPEQQKAIEKAADLNDEFGGFLRSVSAWEGVRVALKTINWAFDAIDTLYETPCIFIGCCTPDAAPA